MKFAVGDRVVCLLKSAPVYKTGGVIMELMSSNPRRYVKAKYDGDDGIYSNGTRAYQEDLLILERLYHSPLYKALL